MIRYTNNKKCTHNIKYNKKKSDLSLMGDFLIYAFHACNSLSAHILTVLGQVQIVNLFLIFFFKPAHILPYPKRDLNHNA